MQAVKRNWKTTLMGIATLFTVGVKVWTTPASITSTETVAAIAGGIGMIVAKDA